MISTRGGGSDGWVCYEGGNVIVAIVKREIASLSCLPACCCVLKLATHFQTTKCQKKKKKKHAASLSLSQKQKRINCTVNLLSLINRPSLLKFLSCPVRPKTIFFFVFVKLNIFFFI